MFERINRESSHSIGEVWERYPACTEYSKVEQVQSLGKFTEFHCDIHVVSVNQTEYYDEILTLDYGDSVVQVIKAGLDDIHDIILGLKGSTLATPLLLDDFESYVDDAALIAAWVPIGVLIDPTLYIADPGEGTQSLSLTFKNNAGSKVTYTYGTDQDWSNYESINFRHASSNTQGGSSFLIRIGDSFGNYMYQSVPAGIFTNWHDHKLIFANFIQEADQVDLTSIRYLEIVVEVYGGNTSFEYFDYFTLDPVIEGTLGIETKIYYFGENPPNLNDTLPDPLVLDDGETSVLTDVYLDYQIRRVHISLGHSHVSSSPHTKIGEYYGIGISNPNIGTTITLAGDFDKSYADGSFYTVTDNELAVDTGNSLAFLVISHVTGYIEKLKLTFDNNPGYGSTLILIYKDVINHVTICVPAIITLEGERLVFEFNFLETNQLFQVTDSYYLAGIFQPSISTLASEVEIYVKGRHNYNR